MPDEKKERFIALKDEAKSIPDRARKIVQTAHAEHAKGNKQAANDALNQLTEMSKGLLAKGKSGHIDLREMLEKIDEMRPKAPEKGK